MHQQSDPMPLPQAILHSEEVAKRHWLQLWRRRHRMVNVHYQQEVCTIQ